MATSDKPTNDDGNMPEPTTQDEAAALFAQFADESDTKAGIRDEAPVEPPPVETPNNEPGETVQGAAGNDTLEGQQQQPPPKEPETVTLTKDQLAQLMELPAAVKSLGGRVASVQSALDKGRQAATEAGAAAPTNTQAATAMRDPEKWKKLKADFPEWAEGIEEFVAANRGGAQAPDMETMRAEMSRLSKEAQEAREELQIVSQHPGWRKTIVTPQFKAWFQSLPPEEQAEGRAAKTPDQIVGVLDKFAQAHQQSALTAPAPSPAAAGRQHQPPPPARNKPNADLAAAATPRGSRGIPPRRVEDMTDEREIFDYYARQDG